jgi:hypothetical protein
MFPEVSRDAINPIHRVLGDPLLASINVTCEFVLSKREFKIDEGVNWRLIRLVVYVVMTAR